MIPKPKKRPCQYSLRKLRGDYAWTSQRFKALRAFIRDADERYLDKSKATHRQSPAQWIAFKLEVVAKFPEIGEFEDNWPLYVILSASRRLIAANMRLEKIRGRSNPGRKRGRRRRAAIAIQRRPYIGKLLPSRVVIRTVNIASVPSPDDASDGAVCGRVENSATRPESSSEIVMTPSISQPAPECLDVQTTTSEESRDSSGDAVANRSPIQISAISHVGSNNAQLITVCQNAKLLINALELLGISNDKHLLVLSKLEKRRAGIVEFFNSLSNNQLPYLYKMTVLKNINDEKFNPLDVESRSCHDNRNSNDDGGLPLLLQTFLNMFDMEELIPLFRTAHVTTDEELMMLRGLDETQRSAIFDQADFAHVRPFQRWILNFVLTSLFNMTESVHC